MNNDENNEIEPKIYIKTVKEEWRDIKGYEGLYSVSNFGNVKSNDRIIETVSGPREFKGRILKTDPTKDNHLRVTLSNAGKKERIFVHRLVAGEFLENPNNYPIINHIDENPTNNRYRNLEWCSYSYNAKYNKRSEKIGDKKGLDVDVYDLDRNFIETMHSVRKTSIKYGINSSTMYRRARDHKPINGHYFKLHL